MAIMINKGQSLGAVIIWANLYEGRTTVSDGEWIDLGGFHPITLQVEGITTGTIQLRGSNEPTRPDNTDHGFQLGEDITADALLSLCVPIRWLKVRITVATTIALNVYLWGRE